MPIDPGLRVLIDTPGLEMLPPPAELGAPGLRAAMAATPAAPIEKEPVHATRDLEVPGPAGRLRVRLYYPVAADKLPLVVFFHGGGFVLCDIETHDPLCRSLARASGCAVASVEYRLAPEARFPEPLEDCYAATRWLVANAGELGLDETRVAVSGDSAGGALAAAVTLLARERGGPRLSHQALLCPVTDAACDTASMRELARGYWLTRDIMQWFWACYLPGPEHGTNPLASPLRAADLSGLPPATVVTAEFDPVRDEGEAYARRLREAAVPVVARRYLGMLHGFLSLPHLTPVASRAIADVGSDIRAALQAG